LQSPAPTDPSIGLRLINTSPNENVLDGPSSSSSSSPLAAKLKPSFMNKRSKLDSEGFALDTEVDLMPAFHKKATKRSQLPSLVINRNATSSRLRLRKKKKKVESKTTDGMNGTINICSSDEDDFDSVRFKKYNFQQSNLYR